MGRSSRGSSYADLFHSQDIQRVRMSFINSKSLKVRLSLVYHEDIPKRRLRYTHRRLICHEAK
ncbi:hypothetical protein H5410_045017 [Solanum commersonii]|uniref:Uncharacterized protein n=1 Tax=Solanum commersonii TaxID=4109 RepID=A0A9J5XAB4_SOLCO|nr:hypothetical protein H5410_045017 [Solanum commersonii]